MTKKKPPKTKAEIKTEREVRAATQHHDRLMRSLGTRKKKKKKK